MTTLNTSMLDYEPVAADDVTGDEFVALARELLRLRNTGNFADNWLEIRTNYNGLDLQVSRLRQLVPIEQPEKRHLSVENPVTMVSKGAVIRHHGEHIYLTTHLRDLIAAATPAEETDEPSGD